MCARVTAMNYTITRYWPHTSHYGQRIVNSANISFLESSEEMRIIKMLPSWLLVVIGHRVNKNFMSFRTTISCFITQEDCLQARSCCSWSSWIDFIFYNLLQLNLDPESITKLKNLTRSKFWKLFKSQYYSANIYIFPFGSTTLLWLWWNYNISSNNACLKTIHWLSKAGLHGGSSGVAELHDKLQQIFYPA